eukprot:EG_transcript_25883
MGHIFGVSYFQWMGRRSSKAHLCITQGEVSRRTAVGAGRDLPATQTKQRRGGGKGVVAVGQAGPGVYIWRVADGQQRWRVGAWLTPPSPPPQVRSPSAEQIRMKVI